MKQNICVASCRLKIFLLSIFAFWPMLFLSATVLALDVMADDAKPTKSLSIKSQKNGSLAVSVARPQDGFSYNRFKQYNAKNNIYINNKNAEVIVLEVVGDQLSGLSGTIEVVGKKAKLILVNPNGINCDGCAFVNVGDVELRADKFLAINDGQIQWGKNNNSVISIGKNGVNTSGSLLLRAGRVQIIGSVIAQGGLQIESEAAGSYPNNDNYAINIDQGVITAADLRLVASGELAAIRIYAPQSINSDGEQNGCKINSEKNIYIESKGNIDITGSLYSKNNFKIVGKNVSVFQDASSGGKYEIGVNGGLEIEGELIHLDNGVLLNGDKYLKLTAGNLSGSGDLKSQGIISVLSFKDLGFNQVNSHKKVMLGATGDISGVAINANQAGDVLLSGQKIDIKSISSTQNLIMQGREVTNDLKLNDIGNLEILDAASKDTERQRDFIINTPFVVNGDFKFVGKNLVNHSIFKAKNISLSLSGSFLNHKQAQIIVEGVLNSSSKDFANYGQVQVANDLQIKSDTLVNDDGGKISAGAIYVYLNGKKDNGNAFYHGLDSLLEARAGDIKLIAPFGSFYFGYKKEMTGDGDNRDGFQFIGSQLINHKGQTHIQSGGDVLFEGVQTLGKVIVEAKGFIRKVDPEGKYQKGSQQVYDYTETWCPTVDTPWGCPGGPKSKDHYKNVPHFQPVVLKTNFVGESFSQYQHDLNFLSEKHQDNDLGENFLKEFSNEHTGFVVDNSNRDAQESSRVLRYEL